jgi:hypothetical protein
VNLSNELDKNPYEERFERWQEHRQEQLGFLNNVLIGLGAGLIGFAMGHLPRSGFTAGPRWESVVFGLALSGITLSVAFGLCLAVNRLRSIRMTASRNRVKFLWQVSSTEEDKILPEKISRHYKHWNQWSRLQITGRSRELFESSGECLSFSEFKDLKSPDEKAMKAAREKAMKAANEWENGLDNWTYRLLWSEFLMFAIGALLFAIIPIYESLKF